MAIRTSGPIRTANGLLNKVTERSRTPHNTYGNTSGALTSITDDRSHVTTMNTVNGTGPPTHHFRPENRTF